MLMDGSPEVSGIAEQNNKVAELERPLILGLALATNSSHNSRWDIFSVIISFIKIPKRNGVKLSV